VILDAALRNSSTAQYVDGFDACTREVSDCLQSQNITVSPELYAGLLSHLATCRRRLMLARCRDHQRATVPPPAECPRLYSDENSSCLQNIVARRQGHAASGELNRSPLLSITNVQVMPVSADETSVKAKPQIICNNNERTSEHSCMEQTFVTGAISVPADINCSQRTDSCTSHDVIDETDHQGTLSLATDEDVTSLIWRPW